MKTMIRTFVVCMAFMSLAAFASDYVPSDIAWLVTSMSSGDPAYWPTNAGQWQVEGRDPLGATANLDSDQDYGVKGGKNFRPKIGTATFSGKSLTIGALDRSSNGVLLFRTSKGCDTTFDNEGLFLYCGVMQSWNPGAQIVRGRVTVRSPESNPVALCFCQNGASLTFDDCSVESAAGAGLYVHSLVKDSKDQSQTNFVARFLDNALSNYNGTMIFSPVFYDHRENVSYYTRINYSNYVRPPYYVTFQTDSGTMPGALKLYPNAIIAGESSTTDFSVSSLSTVSLNGYGTNYLSVAMAANGSACSILRVTGTLDLQTPMAVRLSPDVALDLFAATNAAAAMRLPIFKAPSGVTLDPAQFFMERDDAMPYLPMYELEVSTDAGDGLSTLWMVRKPVVWSLNADTSSNTLFTRAAGWSDNHAPTDANDYLALYELRTPGDATSTERVFPGKSLSIISNGMVTVRSCVTRFDDLRVFSRGRIGNLANGISGNPFVSGPDVTFTLNGRIRVDTPVELAQQVNTAFNIVCYPSKAWTINSEISGRGTVYLHNAVQSGNNNPQNGWFAILGMNTNYYGTIHVHNDGASVNNDFRSHLLINDERSLGASMPSFLANALVLDANCALRPLVSMTLEDETRGIYMSGGRTFITVDDGLVLVNKKCITYAGGEVVKDGAGELALGGPLPRFNLSGTAAPQSGKNILNVREGTLRPVSATAFQGLAVIVTNANATLAMDVPVSNDDGDIGQYGMLNTTWDAPLTVPESGLVVQLRDPNGVLADGRSHRVPILTVNATAREALDEKLSVAVPSSCAYSVRSVDWTDNGDETYTLSATISKGFVLIYK